MFPKMQSGFDKLAEISFKASTMLTSDPNLYRFRRWPCDMPETSNDVKEKVTAWKKNEQNIDVANISEMKKRLKFAMPNFKVTKYINSGSYGVVFECFEIADPKKSLVCKIIPIMPNIKFPLIDEINLQRKVSDLGLAPRIIDVSNISAASDAHSCRILMDPMDDVKMNTCIVVMQKCKCSLGDVIRNGRYKSGTIQRLLHKSKNLLVHGDLKCNNTCVTEDDNLVFIDFGRGFLCEGLPEKLSKDGHFLDAMSLLLSVRRHCTRPEGCSALMDIEQYVEKLDMDSNINQKDVNRMRKDLFNAVVKNQSAVIKKYGNC
jgi:hypothetical protein